jgi:hypothetical protein
MTDSLTLSRGRLAAFLACRRRFQLRYRQRLAWPAAPPDEKLALALDRGQRFHQLLHRHFLGLDAAVADSLAEDEVLRRWWRTFVDHGPELPSGRTFSEMTLTVPVGDHLLTGRFDLLVLGPDGIHIFDWKTESRPRPAGALADDLQTRLYLALVVAGSPALGRSALRGPGQPVAADAVTLTYWYVNKPEQPVTLAYNSAWHERNWASLTSLVREIADELAAGAWPKTDDLGECARCAYPVYCDRALAVPETALATSAEPDDWEPEFVVPPLEPERP